MILDVLSKPGSLASAEACDELSAIMVMRLSLVAHEAFTVYTDIGTLRDGRMVQKRSRTSFQAFLLEDRIMSAATFA